MVFIKKLDIRGFKSYKDQADIEDFSPRSNVIVGRNGSGKSNFFAAIRFVLGDAYTGLGREERQALLHEGSGAAVMTAYVEIVFDNSDDRFPTGKPELVLRRTIGVKKDEYSLDRKGATKSDVMNLLESAGFSRSNPYYIVPQGRVTALTNMRDAERLTLLKDVAGTQVYEARRVESLKIMDETNNKRERIDEYLKTIQDRLGELEEEKEELKEYQESDREKRCLEYTIYHQEQQRVQAELEQLDEVRQNGVEETDDNRELFLENENELSGIDAAIDRLKQQMEILMLDKRDLESEKKDALRSRAQIELDVSLLSESQTAAKTSTQKREIELKDVQAQIDQHESQLAKLLPTFEAKKQAEQESKTGLDEAENARKHLYEKQSRSVQYKTKADRDAYLQASIDDINMRLAESKANAMQNQEDMAQYNNEIQGLDADILEMRKRLDSQGNDFNDLETQKKAAEEERQALQDERSRLMRQEERLKQNLDHAQREVQKADDGLRRTCDRATSAGINAVRRIARQENLEGAYGILADLFEVPDTFKTATEVCAGTSLFNYVVDSSETATRLVNALNREKAGRLTFVPLDKVHVRPVDFPKAADAVSLISRLEYDPKFEPAMQQVFGKTIVCPTLQIAAQYARTHGMNAISIQGDRAERKGAMTGGYHDPKQSRLTATKTVSLTRENLEQLQTEADTIRNRLRQLEQEITKAHSKTTKLVHQQSRAESGVGPIRRELQSKTADLQSRKNALQQNQDRQAVIELDMRHLRQQQSQYEDELSTDFKKALTSQEEQQLQQLEASCQGLRGEYAQARSAFSKVDMEKNLLEIALTQNLRPRLERLAVEDTDGDSGGGFGASVRDVSARLQSRQKDLQRTQKNIKAITQKLAETEETFEAAQAGLSENQSARDQKQAEQEEIARAIERNQKRMEKSIQKRSQYAERAAEAARSIRDLGVLPDEAFTKYEGMSSEAASKRLTKVNEALKKFAHVNKKAFEQYNNFTKQKETLMDRRRELDEGQSSIEELIEVLDQRKDEAIQRTFRQVSKEFAGVFEKLAPAGKGQLVMQRRSDKEAAAAATADDTDEEEEEARRDKRSAVSNYTGVAISVSFNSKHDDQQRIQQLSGGQKSLCALALVFAIQQCDPAPFYLFDEIDANLDAQYRTAVAAMIEQLSATGQFICTTFRPELVLKAEKCYGVSYSNKTSSIDVVEREDALEFVDGQKQ